MSGTAAVSGQDKDFAQAREQEARAIDDMLASLHATWPSGLPVPACVVPGLAAHLGPVADAFYDHPSHALDVVAVTGPAPRTGLLRASTICVPRHSGRTVCWLPTGVWMMRTQALLPFPPGQIRLMQVRSVQRMVPVRMMLVRQVNLSGLLPGCAGPKR